MPMPDLSKALCDMQELANADKALRDLQAAGADRSEDIAAKEGKQREFRIRAKANWPLWCAVHGLGDGDDTPSTDAIALPTGGVFAEAVGVLNVPGGC